MKKLSLKGMSHEEWLRLRKQGIGGSDAGAVCGVNPYRSAADVFLDKTSEDTTSDEDNEAMRQGRELEDYAAKRFMEASGLEVRKTGFLYQSEEHPFMLANIDRLVIGENAGLECKTCSAYSAENWKNGMIPESYQIQCQHYMAVMGWDHMYIACVILGKEFLYHRLERDNELIENLIEIERSFWERYVLAGRLPEPDGSKAYDEMLNQHFKAASQDKTLLPLIGFDQDLQRREELTELSEKIEREKSEIDQRLKLYLGEHEAAMNREYRINWTNVTTGRFDSKRFKENHEALYKSYLKESTTRRFTVKKVKSDELEKLSTVAA